VYAADVEGDTWFDHTGAKVEEGLDSLPFDVSGRYEVDYWGRWNNDNDITDDESDQQLFQYLRVDIKNLVRENISLHFSGRLSAELDGRDSGDDFFADIYDTFDHSANGRIYSFYLAIDDPFFKDSKLKLGRMNSYEAETVLFDGAKYEQTIDRARFYVQGGVHATHYDDWNEDTNIAGAGIDYHLFPYTYVGYDFLYSEDEDYDYDDDYHSFDISQRFGSLKTFARFSILNGDADDLNLYGSYYHEPLDMTLTARYYGLFTQRDRNSDEFAALVDVSLVDIDNPDTLGVYSPFHLINLTAYKGHGDVFGATVGFETRWMDDNGDKNDLNREYDRYFVSVEAWDVLVEGLTASVSFEYWDANGAEDSIAVGIDANRDMSEKLNLGGGFYFSRYRLRSTFSGTSYSDDIETPSLYANVKYQCRENVSLVARYEIEDESDLGTTQELRLGCSIEF